MTSSQPSPEAESEPIPRVGHEVIDSALSAAAATQQRRIGSSKEVPAGPKARRTRQRLIETALERFRANGYTATSVAEIAEHAGVSLGTFYQYFRDRSEVLATIVNGAVYLMVTYADTEWRSEEGESGVYRIILNYVRAYAASADTVAVWEEACHIDPEMAQLRRELGRLFTEAVRDELLASGANGRSRTLSETDADMTARALTGMVDRFCYVSYVFDPPASGPPDPSDAAHLLAGLWTRSVELDESPQSSE